MRYLKNHFKKEIVIIVVTMLITIPNLNVYLPIGSYKTSSPAITANNKYKFLYQSENHPRGLGIAISLLVGVSVSVAVFAIVGTTLGAVIGTSLVNVAKGVSLTLHENSDKNYYKYDFSRFDN